MSLWPTRPSFYGDRGKRGGCKEAGSRYSEYICRFAGLLRGRGARVLDRQDLVAGSGLTFEDRGSHELKGFPNFAEPPVLAGDEIPLGTRS
jgi:hypothetical protein